MECYVFSKFARVTVIKKTYNNKCWWEYGKTIIPIYYCCKIHNATLCNCFGKLKLEYTGVVRCSWYLMEKGQVSSVQLLSRVQLFTNPWTAARQASLSIINSQSLLKLMPIELAMSSNHLILCCPLLHPPSIFPSIRVFSNESALRIRWPKYFSFNMSPSNEYSGLISLRMDSIQSAKTSPGADCGSDNELLIAKFRLKLKKVGKTTRPFRYDLNQIPNDYTVEVRNRFKGLGLTE